MIYEYEGKRVVAKNYTEASKMLKITKDELKENGKEVRFVLRDDDEKEKDNYEKLGENHGYSDKLKEMTKKIDGNDSNIHQKMAIAQLKDNPCAICGEQYIPRSMTFHHCDSTTKKFEIRVGRIRFKHLQEEVAKCILLCLNCHGYVHYVEEIPNKEIREEEMRKLYDKYKV